MATTVVTPPAPIVTIDEVRQHLRVDHSDDDAVLTSLIAAAQQAIDGPYGWLGIAISEQTLMQTQPVFCGRYIELSHPPVIGDVVVTYLDSTGAEQTVDPASYSVVNGRLWLAYGYTFPGVYAAPDAVRITYKAGFETIPEPIKQAIKVHVEMNYDPASSDRLTAVYEAFLAPYYNRPV